jgi:hypothetical protein
VGAVTEAACYRPCVDDPRWRSSLPARGQAVRSMVDWVVVAASTSAAAPVWLTSWGALRLGLMGSNGRHGTSSGGAMSLEVECGPSFSHGPRGGRVRGAPTRSHSPRAPDRSGGCGHSSESKSGRLLCFRFLRPLFLSTSHPQDTQLGTHLQHQLLQLQSHYISATGAEEATDSVGDLGASGSASGAAAGGGGGGAGGGRSGLGGMGVAHGSIGTAVRRAMLHPAEQRRGVMGTMRKSWTRASLDIAPSELPLASSGGGCRYRGLQCPSGTPVVPAGPQAGVACTATIHIRIHRAIWRNI